MVPASPIKAHGLDKFAFVSCNFVRTFRNVVEERAASSSLIEKTYGIESLGRD